MKKGKNNELMLALDSMQEYGVLMDLTHSYQESITYAGIPLEISYSAEQKILKVDLWRWFTEQLDKKDKLKI
jgi:hypothetical protein